MSIEFKITPEQNMQFEVNSGGSASGTIEVITEDFPQNAVENDVVIAIKNFKTGIKNVLSEFKLNYVPSSDEVTKGHNYYIKDNDDIYRLVKHPEGKSPVDEGWYEIGKIPTVSNYHPVNYIAFKEPENIQIYPFIQLEAVTIRNPITNIQYMLIRDQIEISGDTLQIVYLNITNNREELNYGFLLEDATGFNVGWHLISEDDEIIPIQGRKIKRYEVGYIYDSSLIIDGLEPISAETLDIFNQLIDIEVANGEYVYMPYSISGGEKKYSWQNMNWSMAHWTNYMAYDLASKNNSSIGRIQTEMTEFDQRIRRLEGNDATGESEL